MMDLDCCDICGEGHSTEFCPELGLNSTPTELDQLSTRARLTLPGYVQVVDNGSGLVGVVAKETISNKTQLGPYEAKRTTHIFDDSGFFTLKLIAKDGTTVCLDTTDENECNWLCLVRAATTYEIKNCIAYQLGSNIYYNTTRDVTPGEELLVWYAPHFARKLGKPSEPDGETRVLLGHRIEPLNSDLLLDTEGQTIHQQVDGTEQQTTEDTVQICHSTHSDKPTGEIRKAFYCPRCGNVFENQTGMVQHLREHVIGSDAAPRRGRGRPRKYPNSSDSKSKSTKVGKAQGRGRPRNSAIIDFSEDGEFDMKRPVKTYGRKRKRESTDSKPDDDDNYDDGDDEDDFADKVVDDNYYREIIADINNDTEYSPKKDISIIGTRVQPRRSTRGKHCKFDEDYVYSTLKREVKEEVTELKLNDTDKYEKNKANFESVKNKKARDNAYRGLNSGSTRKKGQGRPRISMENIESTGAIKESVGTLSVETVKESLLALRGKPMEENREIVVDNLTETNYLEQQENGTKHHEISENVKIANENEENKSNVIETELLETIDTGESAEMKVTHKVNEFEVFDVVNDIAAKVDIIVNDIEQAEMRKEKGVEEGHYENEAVIEDDEIEASEISDDSKMKEVVLKTEDKGSMVVMFEETDDGCYGCALCDDVFTHEIEAISHFMNHTKGAASCKSCLQEFSNLEYLLEHRKICNNVHSNNGEKPCEPGKLSYECDICQQAFKTAHYLYRHMVIHTDVFRCERCSKTFSRKDSLQKHVLKCCPDLADKYKIFYCQVCLRVFSKESGKKRHTEKCKSVQCQSCFKIFMSEGDMSVHTCKSHDLDDSAKYACGRCSKSFQSLYYLKQHQQLHDSHNACERCGKNYASKEELDGHAGLCETLEGIRLYGSGKCNICEQSFSHSKSFRNHFLSHTHPYECEKCQKRFLRIGTLNSHDCEIVVDAACNVCLKTFKNQANLERHLKENGCMRYQCSVCDEQFRTKYAASDHVCTTEANQDVEPEIVSINDTKEVCPTCGKSFSSKSNLTKHMILHGEKKLACPHCPKLFHLDVYLKEHITCVHYNIFKYQCNVCGRMLKSKTGLIAHTRIFHVKNAETYRCTKCGKIFKQKANLRSHMYSHSKVRNFKCEVCIRTFKYPDQLSRHKLEHKLMPKLKCPHCEKEFLRTYDLKKHLQVYHSGYIYVCGICSARCGHRHTLVRHYKRKHPENVHLTSQEGYLDGLLKHVNELYDPSTDQIDIATKCIVLQKGSKLLRKFPRVGDGQQTDNASEMLPQDAAEALHSLALGQATAKQFQLLKDEGLFVHNETNLVPNQDSLVEDQGQVIVPQDSYIFAGHAGEQSAVMANNVASTTVTSQSIDGTIGMIHNPDGSISINGIPGIPQTIEGLNSRDGQIVILQIVDPVSHDPQGAIIQLNQDQQGEIIHLRQDEQGELIHLNHGQQGEVIQLSREQQGEIIHVNQGQGEVIQLDPKQQGEVIHLNNGQQGEVIQLDPEQQGEVIHLNQGQQGEVIQLSQEEEREVINLIQKQQGEIIHLNQGQRVEIVQLNRDQVLHQNEQREVIQLDQDLLANGVYRSAELVHNSEIQTILVENHMNTDDIYTDENEVVVSGITSALTISQNAQITQNEELRSSATPMISLEGDDPNIQAPMVYSQDVICSDEID